MSGQPPIELTAPITIYPFDGFTLYSSVVTLVWRSVQDAEEYTIELHSPSYGEESISTVRVVTPVCTITGLTDGTYEWNVRASSGHLYGEWSAKSAFHVVTSLETPVPVFPVDGAPVNLTNVEFSWQEVEGAGAYVLEISTSFSFTDILAETYSENNWYLCRSPFTNDTTYYWRVRACSQGLWSAWSTPEAFCSIEVSSTAQSSETYVLTWNWTFSEDGSEWSCSFNVSNSEYGACQEMKRDEETPSDFSKYVTATESSVMEIADYLARECEERNYSDYEAVWLALEFVHAVAYVSDSDSKGTDEYPRYPLETLIDSEGDCEDTAALFCSITRAMGYESVMLYIYAIFGVSSNHMASAVAGVEMSAGSCTIEYGGLIYGYCETTPGDWTPGQLPEALERAHYVVVP
jgi:predicted transglutaminase-like cysteine proteinase